MTRKVTVNLYMTLDGYGEFPKYPGSDFIPKDPDAQFNFGLECILDGVGTLMRKTPSARPRPARSGHSGSA